MNSRERFVIGLLIAMGAVFAGAGSVSAQTAADADFDGSGDVGFGDFVLFAAKFGLSQGDANYDARFDLDDSGDVGFGDFVAFAGLFGEIVPVPELALTGIAPAEGMPGTLIELLGQFDADTAYQVKFGAVSFPVFAQDAERITAMVPVLETGSVPVRVVDPSGRESDPTSFEVLALPEPRMNVEQLQQTVSDVGDGIGNVLAPVIDAGVFPNDADAASFNREMDKLNAAWGVIGQRIAALPPEDAALLTQLLDNSGALAILEGLGTIDLSASKVPAESTSTHQIFFRVDIVSALLGYAADVTLALTIANAVFPDPLFTKAMTAALGGFSTFIGVVKSGIDAAIPTDLQRVSKVEIDPTPVPVGGVSDVAFYGEFKTESNLLAELGSEGVGKGMEEIVKVFILRKKGEKFLEELQENPVVSDAVDGIVGFFSGILSDVGFGVTGLENLFDKVGLPRNDVRLDMSLYRLSAPSIIKWLIPPFPAEEIDKMLRVLERVGIDVVSESVEVVDRDDVVNEDVAVYDPATVQLTGKKAGAMRLKMRAFRFVEPGGESGDEPEDENRSFLGRVWDRAKQIAAIPLDFLKNLHPIFRFSNSMERLDPVYAEFSVKVPGSDIEEPLFDESIRRLTNGAYHGNYLAWSPDGSHIAFDSYRDGNAEIYVVGSDGSNMRNLTNNDASDVDPAWSPDSRHIAFVSERDGNKEIYVIGLDGSNPRNLTNNDARDDDPAWSPDGRHIAFGTNRDDEDVPYTDMREIYVMGSDGSNPRRLTNNNDVWDHSPAWSPDGRHIAYTYIGTRSSFSAVGVMESDGSNRRSVAYGNLATWSPDGRQIAYRYGRGIGAVGLDGSNGRSLSRDYGTGPAWSPDGWHIAFRRRKDVYVMGPYGSNPRNLSNLPVPYIGADYTNLVWSPDGRHIAFAARSNGTDEIYVITFHPMTDREALVLLYTNTNPGLTNPNELGWTNSLNWRRHDDPSNDRPLGEWYGVGTNAQGRVDGLNLSENHLRGSIPDELGGLTQLTNLDLRRNQLQGNIPDELGNLTQLQTLALHENQLSGPIPESLGSLRNLTYLTLHQNRLSGSIPEALGNLTNLTMELNLSRNQLTGTIPDSLGNLTQLSELYLNDNELTGSIPEALGNLTQLRTLALHENQLSGPIPAELGNLADLTQLTELNLSRNQLTGKIPESLGNLTQLTELNLSRNQLTGKIPESLGNLTQLTELNLSNNELRGFIPLTFGNLTNLKHLKLAGNANLCLPDSLQTWAESRQLSDAQNPPVCSRSDLIVARSIRRLTNSAWKEFEPEWSPDGRYIAFIVISAVSTRTSGIYVIGSDGSSPRRLTNDNLEREPAWSPDGGHIAFTTSRHVDRDGNYEIYVMGSDGSSPRRLTNNNDWDGDPAWSPDGRHIAFASYRDGDAKIYVMGSDGGSPRRLTNHAGGDWEPTWSPDGRHIAFTSYRDGNYEIYVMGSDGGSPRRLTYHVGKDWGPAWSPDGRHIAFTTDRDGNDGIYVMGSDGGSPRRLTYNNDWNGDPAWSPDGGHIAFASSRTNVAKIYVMELDIGGAAKPAVAVEDMSLPGSAMKVFGDEAREKDGSFSPRPIMDR